MSAIERFWLNLSLVKELEISDITSGARDTRFRTTTVKSPSRELEHSALFRRSKPIPEPLPKKSALPAPSRDEIEYAGNCQ